MSRIRRIAVLAIAVVMTLLLAACGQGAGSAASSSGNNGGSGSDANLVGSPWVTSILAGNLPSTQPDAKDDVYTHYNYEYLATHQSSPTNTMNEYSGELQAAVTTIIKDGSKTGHDLDQLRIFYNQATDQEALKAIGMSEVQPYLDRIDAVSSIDEMNSLLTDDNFPFDPFILASLSVNDTRGTNIVAVNPNFMFTNALIEGGTYYQDTNNAQLKQEMQAIIYNNASFSMVDLMSAGMDQNTVNNAVQKLVAFETAHGKHLESTSMYLKADYGAMAQSGRESYFTLDELCSFAPNVPLKGMLDKMGKGGSNSYGSSKAWLEAFNGLWTEDNLETIKLAAKVQVLAETRPYRDPSFLNSIYEQAGQAVPDADAFAFSACSSIDTLGSVIAKTYVDDVLGPHAKERLTTLSQELVDTYKDLVGQTSWMGDESRQRVIEKLDHVSLNILEPSCGYLDYSALELTPTSEGGTLMSNYLKLKKYHQDCENKLIGQPAVTCTIWFALSPTMNQAFYDLASNSINVFPGYVTSLIYTEDMGDAELLAGAGFTIGHEISHGFDYLGSQLDAYGTPNPVFADADVDKFVLKSSSLALYYSKIEVMPGWNVDGENVAGEATADLCGMQACLELASGIDGFDYDKFFDYLSYVWAQVTDEANLQVAMLDVHAPRNLRVNVSLQMFETVYEKLGIAEGDGMYLAPNERIVIWGPNA